MSKRDIASVACKILALWLVVQGVLYIGDIIETIKGIISSIQIGNYSVAVADVMRSNGFIAVLFLVPAWVMWAKSERLAVVMVGDEDKGGSQRKIAKEEWIGIAAAALGIFLFTKGVVNLVYVVVWGYELRRIGEGNVLDADRILAWIVQMAVAVWLMVGLGGIVRLMRKFRTMGTRG